MSELLAIKTVEFSLSSARCPTIDRWLDTLRWVWNEGLRLLLELEANTATYQAVEYELTFEPCWAAFKVNPDLLFWTSFTVAAKKVWHRAPCCPIQWSYRWLLEGETWVSVPYTPYARTKPYRPACPLTPAGSTYSTLNLPTRPRASLNLQRGHQPLNLATVRRQQGLEAVEAEIKSLLLQGIVRAYPPLTLPAWLKRYNTLERPWQEPRLDQFSAFSLAKYFAQKRHPDKPWLAEVPAGFVRGCTTALAKAWERYKAKKAKQPRFKRKGDQVGTLLHEDGKVIRVERKPIVDEHGIIQRYVGRILIPKLGWFKLKDFEQRWGEAKILTLKVCKRPSGYYLQLTGKFPVKPAKVSTRSLGLALPQEEGLLYVDDQGKQCFVPPDSAKLLQQLDALQKQLARQTFLGSNWKKTKQKIGKIHERLRLRARNYLHKRTTFLIRTYGTIAVQQVKAGTVKHPAPVVLDLDPTEYAKTGAERVATFNKKRVRLRTGQFVDFLEAKALTAGRVFRKVDAKPEKRDSQSFQALANNIR